MVAIQSESFRSVTWVKINEVREDCGELAANR